MSTPITAAEFLRAAIQKMLDDGDGWILDDFVLALGLQRMNSDGAIESVPWVWAPPDQADWKTDGLLRAALDLRDVADIDNTD